jgi:hypothetical protein
MRFLMAILLFALCTLLLTVAGPNLFGLLIAFAVPNRHCDHRRVGVLTAALPREANLCANAAAQS